MPTVRELSKQLHVNPCTVSRSYQILGNEGRLKANNRGGTVVLEKPINAHESTLHQSKLDSMINESILDALSLGYNPDELEAAFNLQLGNRCKQYYGSGKFIPDPVVNLPVFTDTRTINIIGSNDLALDLLINHMKSQHPEILFKVTPAGSAGGLIAILEGKADMAGTHLLDGDTGEYNIPFIKHTLQDVNVVVVHLVDRIQGLMVARGNPKNIKGIEDLKRPDICFSNRQKGSGTRVLLDHSLKELGIIPHEVKGYYHEMDTHIGVAMSIAHGEADVGLGIQSAASSCGLEFIPSTKERFDLVIPSYNYHNQIFSDLMKIMCSDDFKRVVLAMGGYDTTQTGEILLK